MPDALRAAWHRYVDLLTPRRPAPVAARLQAGLSPRASLLRFDMLGPCSRSATTTLRSPCAPISPRRTRARGSASLRPAPGGRAPSASRSPPRRARPRAAGCVASARRRSRPAPRWAVTRESSALSDAAVEAIHRISIDPGRLSKRWFDALASQGLGDAAYVELVGVVSTLVSVDAFCRAIGVPPHPLPDPPARRAHARAARGRGRSGRVGRDALRRARQRVARALVGARRGREPPGARARCTMSGSISSPRSARPAARSTAGRWSSSPAASLRCGNASIERRPTQCCSGRAASWKDARSTSAR